AAIVSSIGIMLVIGAPSDVTTGVIPGIQGCSWSSHDVRSFLPFILLFVFQLGLVCLTITRAIQGWRSARGPLYAVLVKHNIFYYACGLFFSAMNVLLPILLVDMYFLFSCLICLEIFILAILATRMHLHLWHIERRVNGSEALVCISVSDMPIPLYKLGLEGRD
ncbi:hypothetical protein F4604DRAFT_1832120, partial [Suillus subluteus]